MAVRAAVAPLLGDARISASLTSQLLAGELVDVLEERADWIRVRGPDAYEGWTHRGYLTAPTGDESAWAYSLGATVCDAGGERRLPLGARVSSGAETVEGEVVAARALRARFPREGTLIAASAASLFRGTSYLWGGVTPWGSDCSGFVQRVFALHGVALLRDAWLQAGQGTERTGGAGEPHAAGDLLYFTDREDRRVTHVGIALGGARMVHSSLSRGGVAVEQMDGDDPYVVRLRAGCTGVRGVL